jgi:hypothetical protein
MRVADKQSAKAPGARKRARLIKATLCRCAGTGPRPGPRVARFHKYVPLDTHRTPIGHTHTFETTLHRK